MKTRSKIGWSLLAILLLLAAGAFAYIRSMQPQLALGVGYGARVACACRYIGNRPLAQCYADFEPGMEPITLTDDPATRTVTASVPLIASRSVTFDPELGCQPEPLR
ncbi:hypothetical protein [Sphingomonas japonica]|uniref:Uncharacterized protein n=1 Tax=Sphingomonas japonica TaxID=511662 RepID=A0ABX0TYY9_9SPHN|nr:hypothetical protein [Sphingomonas japonica]NIJ23443.1 hypothetical protein [Sphingomonas japonica]